MPLERCLRCEHPLVEHDILGRCHSMCIDDEARSVWQCSCGRVRVHALTSEGVVRP